MSLRLGNSKLYTDNHYLHAVHEQTNLFSLSGTAALAQEQSYFGPLHSSSGNHTALWGLGMVVHGSSTSWVPLGEKLEDHLEWAGVWLQYYPVPLATAPAVDQKPSSDILRKENCNVLAEDNDGMTALHIAMHATVPCTWQVTRAVYGGAVYEVYTLASVLRPVMPIWWWAWVGKSGCMELGPILATAEGCTREPHN